MEQHPVPQNISSYEFHLVGDMTLKQFFQLAGGVLVGLLFTRLPLPFILKWPLAGVAVLVGIMLAFVPVNGRPFSQWILAFIRAIYSPTEFSWKYVPAQPEAPLQAIEPLPKPNKTNHALEALETQVMSRISSLFNSAHPPVAPTPQVAAQTLVAEIVPTSAPPLTVPPISSQPTTTTTTSVVLEPRKPIMVAEVIDQSELPVQNNNTPPQPPITSEPIVPPLPTPAVTPMVPHAPVQAAQPAIVATNLVPPERPNLISGQIVSVAGQGLDGVIVEVTDSSTGIPVRALKSNRVGQFQSATPLKNGRYTIVLEKENLIFDPVTIEAEGSIINPILITAKA